MSISPDSSDFEGSLEGLWAREHWLGRSPEEVQALFERNLFHWGEPLVWLGPVACAYYGRLAMAAAWNCMKRGEGGESLSDLLDLLLTCASDGWKVGSQAGFTDEVRAFCDRVESEYDALGIDDWHADIPVKLAKLKHKLGTR